MGPEDWEFTSARKLGAYTTVLVTMMFPIGSGLESDSVGAHKYGVCRDLCEIMRQVHSNANAEGDGEKYYADPHLVEIHQLPQWMKDFKTSLDQSDRENSMTPKQVVAKFFREMDHLADTLIQNERVRMFYRNFCLDRMLNMAYTAAHFASEGNEAGKEYIQAYLAWDEDKGKAIRNELKKARFVRPLGCSSWF